MKLIINILLFSIVFVVTGCQSTVRHVFNTYLPAPKSRETEVVYSVQGDGWSAKSTFTPIGREHWTPGYGFQGPLPASVVEPEREPRRERYRSWDGGYEYSLEETISSGPYLATDESGRVGVRVDTHRYRTRSGARWEPTAPVLNWHVDPKGPRANYVEGTPVPLGLRMFLKKK